MTAINNGRTGTDSGTIQTKFPTLVPTADDFRTDRVDLIQELESLFNYLGPTPELLPLNWHVNGQNIYVNDDTSELDVQSDDGNTGTYLTPNDMGAFNSAGEEVSVQPTGIFLTTGSAYAQILFGTGSPQGVHAAPVGSVYFRTDGGTSTTFYVKETGTTTSSGWVAK